MIEKTVELEWIQFYEETPLEDLPWEVGEPSPELVELVEKGEVKPCRALDICCGIGTQSIYLASQGFQVTGIDISPQAIEYAREKARAAEVKADFLVGDSTDLKFPSSSFDFVFDRGCFHHIPQENRSDYIQGVHRVLTPHGRLQLLCFSEKNGPAWNHFTTEEIKKYFEDRFKILGLKPTIFRQKDGTIKHFYAVLMEKI